MVVVGELSFLGDLNVFSVFGVFQSGSGLSLSLGSSLLFCCRTKHPLCGHQTPLTPLMNDAGSETLFIFNPFEIYI